MKRRAFLHLCAYCGVSAISTGAVSQATMHSFCTTDEGVVPDPGGLVRFGAGEPSPSLQPLMTNALISDHKFTEFGVAALRDRWEPRDGLTPDGKVTLGIHFLNGTPADHARTQEAAVVWLAGDNAAYLDFVWRVPVERANIRVSCGGPGNWSRLGNQAKLITNLQTPTMMIQQLSDWVIRHEFGHALGLRHEHLHPNFGGRVDWKSAEEITAQIRASGDTNWTVEHTRANILARPETNTQCIGDPGINDASVMIYQVEPSWNHNNFSARPSNNVTERDLRCIRGLYSVRAS